MVAKIHWKNPKNQSKKFDKWQEEVDMILESQV
jgi:hypothetical protein